jgi:hypothetical protein
MVSIGNFFFTHRNALFPVAYLLAFAPGPRVFDEQILAAAIGTAVTGVGSVCSLLTEAGCHRPAAKARIACLRHEAGREVQAPPRAKVSAVSAPLRPRPQADSRQPRRRPPARRLFTPKNP